MSDNPSSDNKQQGSGLSPLDSLSLPATLLQVVNWLSRQRSASFAEIKEGSGLERKKLESALSTLQDAGYIREVTSGERIHYRMVYSGKPGRAARGLSDDIWASVEADDKSGDHPAP